MTKQIRSTVLIMLLLLSINLSAQNNFWTNSNSSEFRSALKERISTPAKYRTIALNTESFLDFVSEAKGRFSDNGGNTLLITLPLPNGENQIFTIEDSELMHPQLAAKFPQLKTYTGKGITDRTASLRITYSPYFGFSGMILSGEHSTVYIDPITSDNKHYMSYFRTDLSQTAIDFDCKTEDAIIEQIDMDGQSQRAPALGDCNLRRYRLAQSCTGEYAQYHIGQAGGTTGSTAGDKAIVQAAMNVTMNRVNGIYERDLGITMQMVANNDLVIYLNAASDPWTNEWNTRTAQTLDAQIGVSNYDIGHNFNTTGGGNAGCIDCVCLSVSQSGRHKGRAYTGRTAPIGDPFDVDYVAHEMGHQFGGYHVQSNSSCRSGSGSSEVEPGSGSTIMGYAGICAANVQNASDDYFAYVNIRDIVYSINYGNASACAELIASGNSGPTADAGLNYAIPKSTPFKLEGIGSDPNDSGLTYCWEQNNPENPNSNSAPIPTRTVGPMFRSLAPVAVPYRYFPNINAIINNTTPTFEVLPSVSRSMNFSFIVRDNNAVSGCTASDLMTVTTVGAAGPFVVSSPNTNLTWNAGTVQNVTWNVAGTTGNGINAANVDIFLSTDGGYTYPISLATAVPNNGSHAIVVPNNQGTQNRVMVKASNNIFFDISNTNFTIGIPVVCSANDPTGLVASNVASSSATLSWDEVTGAGYDLRYREVGSSTWTTIYVSALTTNVTGLDPLTDYEAQIRSNCSGGATSAFTSSVLFTTLDTPLCTGTLIDTYPYLETFDSGIGDWIQVTGDDGDWTLNSNSTPSAGTGPSNDITGGGNYFYTEASAGAGDLGSNATVILESPCFDLRSVTSGVFSFYYHMFGDTVGSLNLEVTTDDSFSWTTIFSASGNSGDLWNVENIDISNYYGEVVKFRFIGLTGNGWSSDIAIDHIGIGDPVIIPINYCTSNGNSTNDEYIGRVQLNTLDNNNSGPGTSGTGYSNFTVNSALTTTLVGGMQYTITITPVWSGNIYNEGYAVWIDYNNNGNFNDSGEQVWAQAPTNNATVSGTFTVPNNIKYGPTRMRVSLKYNAIPGACESFNYGEVEDYTVNLGYDGLLFTNNGWIPNAPSETTSTANALVLDGTYSVDSNIVLNNLTVNNVATLEVLEGESVELNGNLINNGEVILNSTSTQYASLIANGSVTGDVVYKRHVNTNASAGGNDLISAPVTGQTFGVFAAANTNIVSNPNTTTEKLFGPFDKVTGTYLTYDTNVTSEASITLNPAIGYRAASTDDGTFEFKGTVNTETINTTISNSGPAYSEWNLIGNPFPSYIKLSDFLSANIAEFLSTSVAVYGYDGNTSNKWKIWNMAYALNNPNSIITPGQGFFVTSKLDEGTMIFNKTLRTIASGNALLDDDFIDNRDENNNDIAYLKLEMNSSSNSYNTDFYFTNLASRGLDPGFDATVFNGTAPNYAIYSHLVENNSGLDMAIQSLSFDDINDNLSIPLGLNIAQGEQISVGIANSSLPSNVEIYLEDRQMNTFALLNTSNYSITTTTALSGTGRFYLRFSQSTLGLSDPNFEAVEIFNVDASYIITVRGQLNADSKLTIYDLQGRLIKTEMLKANENLYYINAPRLSAGIYMVKLKNELQEKTRKIIIK